ncbi:unnamed protein product [Chilo suppressalis]|uniref:Uncharacterized protein n=1 Tax=Chilo suppressalis TaxID=168631 RepID=A0ABN8AUV9_CHISP|nr:unnamed protein product [Chilo suppressalis]
MEHQEGKVWQSAVSVWRDTIGRFVTAPGEVTVGMSEVPEVVVEGCNGVDDVEDNDVLHQNGDEGLAIDPKLGCRVRFPSDVIRETDVKVCEEFKASAGRVAWAGVARPPKRQSAFCLRAGYRLCRVAFPSLLTLHFSVKYW